MIPDIDPQLLQTAFTHRSYLNESDTLVSESNERLEYLGDAVLELVVSEYLYHRFGDKPEGELTSIRAALVKTTTLAEVAAQLGLGDSILMSKGEAQTGGRTNASLLADTLEAVIGAIYLDKGFDTVRTFLDEHLFVRTDSILENNLHRDFKSTFQERVQSQGHPTPTYQVLAEEGPDHVKTFTVALMVGNRQVSQGQGKSKQAAQQQAARFGLKALDEGLLL